MTSIHLDNQTLGSVLAGLRTAAKLTKAELAELVGVSGQTIDNWETGRNGMSPENLKKIAGIFDVEPETLAGAQVVKVAPQVEGLLINYVPLSPAEVALVSAYRSRDSRKLLALVMSLIEK